MDEVHDVSNSKQAIHKTIWISVKLKPSELKLVTKSDWYGLTSFNISFCEVGIFSSNLKQLLF